MQDATLSAYSTVFAGRVVGEVRAKAKHRVFLVRYSRFGLVEAGEDKNNNSDGCEMRSFPSS